MLHSRLGTRRCFSGSSGPMLPSCITAPRTGPGNAAQGPLLAELASELNARGRKKLRTVLQRHQIDSRSNEAEK